MLDYIEYLGLPVKVAIVFVAAFLIMQLVGEILEFKGKVVPEFVKIRKVFARRKNERAIMEDVARTLPEVKRSLADMNEHYSIDNIHMRDEWMKHVNQKLEQNEAGVRDLSAKLDKNNQDTLSLLIDSKRNSIIGFASKVADEKSVVTREQFNRVFKVHKEYEDMIRENGMTNGEVDIAIRIIRESYENHMRNYTFLEDIRGYNT